MSLEVGVVRRPFWAPSVVPDVDLTASEAQPELTSETAGEVEVLGLPYPRPVLGLGFDLSVEGSGVLRVYQAAVAAGETPAAQTLSGDRAGEEVHLRLLEV